MAPIAGVNVTDIQEKARKDLLNLLEGVRGKKNLVLEKDLAGPIGVFVKFSTLQDYGVDRVFFLENDNVDSSQRNVIFLTRGEHTKSVQAVAEQIKRLQRTTQIDHDFHIFLLPRRTLVCNQVLEDAGVLGDVSTAEFPLYFIPLETDLLSLELPDSFGDLYLRGDPTCIFMAARSLMLIQQQHGLFPRILGKGDNSRRLADLLIRMRSEVAAGEDIKSAASTVGLTPSSSIESLIVIDREVDFATPLLTQLTYEGLLDELYSVQDNQAEVDTSIVGAANPSQPNQGSSRSAATQKGMKRKIQLDSSDKLYSQLRDSNFAIVGSLLNRVARRLESDYESRHVARTTSELREFVNKLPGFQAEQQSLKIHTGLAEDIMKYTRSDVFSRLLEVQQNIAAGADPSTQHESIEELIARDVPLAHILRLLCLESCICGGVRPKDLENFKRQILHGYGFQHILTLDTLEKLQLLQSRSSANALLIPTTASAGSAGSKTNYNSLRKSLRLIVDEVNEQDPNDISYVYSGYAPLSVRLVQCLLQKQYLLSLTKGGSTASSTTAQGASQGWRGFEDALKSIRGATVDEIQRGEEKAVRARQILNGQNERKTVVVFFLGGISFAEIAALRYIAKQEEARRQIIICTTSIISGNRMMDAATERASFKKV
ncbi:Sec1-like protein [Xylona heveae TC161]|uniref:Sec1-like protein n=1 Tax=Xylona heveae (strain CBS 132557 / TC161) TaxID=1328760 RepID=A0A165JBI0_XYLHT|nr:Sec1-like protein [Xylona heveae TC161]KZF26012.1 Sec1-like protein [Xylona heveae TC161]